MITVCYCFNQSRFSQFKVSFQSLLSTNDNVSLCCFTWDLDTQQLYDFFSTLSFEDYRVFDITDYLKKLDLSPVYSRFIISDFIDDPVFIYLDTDTFIIGGLSFISSELYVMPHYAFAAASDCVPWQHRKFIGCEERYYNIGVLVFNNQRYREHYRKRFISLARDNDFIFKDQDIFNTVVSPRRVLLLDSRYNFMSQFNFYSSRFLTLVSHMTIDHDTVPVVYHFNGGSSCHSPLRRCQYWLYWHLPKFLFEFISFFAYEFYFSSRYLYLVIKRVVKDIAYAK